MTYNLLGMIYKKMILILNVNSKVMSYEPLITKMS
jgi:hypothetical protein